MKKLIPLRALIMRELPFLFSLPALIWQLLFLCLPIAIIVYFSFAGNGIFSFAHYRQLFDWTHVRVIMRSLILGLCTSFTCLLCAYPVAYFLAIKAGRWKNILLAFLLVPLWTNFLIQVYGWFFLIERNGLINLLLLKLGIIAEPLSLANNIITVFVVMVYCYLPFMIMPLYTILEKFDVRLLEASADLGASASKTFFTVTLPLTVSGIRTGVLLTFVLGFGEFAIPALVGGGKYMMVGSLIYYYFLVMRDNALGAAFTCLSGIVLLLVSLMLYRFLGKWCVQDKVIEL
jgi:ABC-type spermidine/putrescine transport system permease subunit I